MKEPWAQLVSLEGGQYIPVTKNNFTIGRGKSELRELTAWNNCSSNIDNNCI